MKLLYSLISTLRHILYKKPDRVLNWIEVPSANILSNYHHIQSLQPDMSIFPVVKSNAYGHGLKQIVEILNQTNAQMIAVDSFLEYQTVRRYSSKHILLLGETLHENYNLFDAQKTSFCIWNISTLEHLISLHKPFRIHLFLNTGMNREGIQERELAQFLDILQGTKITLEGVCSHLADGDNLDMTDTNRQIAVFKKLYAKIVSKGFQPEYRHIQASTGILKIQDSFFNAVRPGIILYGYNPLSVEDDFYKNGMLLKPALDLYSTITAIQEIHSGEGVGYNLTNRVDTSRRIASIPCGYTEGLDRRLSNNFTLTEGDSEIAIAGKVCMNISMYDTTNLDMKIGDQLHLISSDVAHTQSINNIAKKIQTISYEVLVKLSPTIRRIIK
ncbi:alanine racemase [Candidatus Gracilibacteria bacterium]|nr:alanine racemase [Candidatus Gracilibacteria bacterium]